MALRGGDAGAPDACLGAVGGHARDLVAPVWGSDRPAGGVPGQAPVQSRCRVLRDERVLRARGRGGGGDPAGGGTAAAAAGEERQGDAFVETGGRRGGGRGAEELFGESVARAAVCDFGGEFFSSWNVFVDCYTARCVAGVFVFGPWWGRTVADSRCRVSKAYCEMGYEPTACPDGDTVYDDSVGGVMP